MTYLSIKLLKKICGVSGVEMEVKTETKNDVPFLALLKRFVHVQNPINKMLCSHLNLG